MHNSSSTCLACIPLALLGNPKIRGLYLFNNLIFSPPSMASISRIWIFFLHLSVPLVLVHIVYICSSSSQLHTICLLCSMIRNTRLVFSHNELSKLTMMNHQMDYRTLRRAIFTKNLYNFSAFTTYLQDSARKISMYCTFFIRKWSC